MTTPRWAHDTPHGRFYAVPDVDHEIQLLPSVSTVLKQLRNPWLEEWGRREAVRNVLETPELLDLAKTDLVSAVRAAEPVPGPAAAWGTAIHSAIEERHESPPSVELRPYVIAYERLMEGLDAVEMMQEVTVFSHEYGYAGTTDGVWWVPGLGNVVVDIKTGNMYDSYRWQLSAYARAEGRWDGAVHEWTVNRHVGLLLNIHRPEAPRVVIVDLRRAWPVMRCLAELRRALNREV